jgi:uncharacterized protein with NRDE domain
MCIIAWNWQPNTDIPLVLIGNRDEFYDRPTLPLHWWYGNQILAGKDLLAGGTWLGVSQNGRLAALTNYRNFNLPNITTTSRGELVKNFLTSDLSSLDYLENLKKISENYSSFNLIVFDKKFLFGFESRNKKIIRLNSGIGVLSNGDLDSSWFKMNLLRESFNKIDLDNNKNSLIIFFELLKNNQQADIDNLPSTGLSIEMERELSSVFINTPVYGTRASSLIKVSSSSMSFSEITYSSKLLLEKNSFKFNF